MPAEANGKKNTAIKHEETVQRNCLFCMGKIKNSRSAASASLPLLPSPTAFFRKHGDNVRVETGKIEKLSLRNHPH